MSRILFRTARLESLPSAVLRVPREFRESDERMCKNIGVPQEIGAVAMAKLWKRPFSAERDRRAGPGANAQHKGRLHGN